MRYFYSTHKHNSKYRAFVSYTHYLVFPCSTCNNVIRFEKNGFERKCTCTLGIVRKHSVHCYHMIVVCSHSLCTMSLVVERNDVVDHLLWYEVYNHYSGAAAMQRRALCYISIFHRNLINILSRCPRRCIELGA